MARCRPKLTCMPCHAPPCDACAVLKKFQGHLRSGSKLELLSLRELEDVDEPTARLLYNAGGWRIGQGGWRLRWVDANVAADGHLPMWLLSLLHLPMWLLPLLGCSAVDLA